MPLLPFASTHSPSSPFLCIAERNDSRSLYGVGAAGRRASIRDRVTGTSAITLSDCNGVRVPVTAPAAERNRYRQQSVLNIVIDGVAIRRQLRSRIRA